VTSPEAVESRPPSSDRVVGFATCPIAPAANCSTGATAGESVARVCVRVEVAVEAVRDSVGVMGVTVEAAGPSVETVCRAAGRSELVVFASVWSTVPAAFSPAALGALAEGATLALTEGAPARAAAASAGCAVLVIATVAACEVLATVGASPLAPELGEDAPGAGESSGEIEAGEDGLAGRATLGAVLGVDASAGGEVGVVAALVVACATVPVAICPAAPRTPGAAAALAAPSSSIAAHVVIPPRPRRRRFESR
jgi:hypothetical protein